jgi:hypothetical protein
MPNLVTLEQTAGNDETYTLTVTSEGTRQPFDLTGTTVEVYYKTTASTADTDPSTVKLSTATGEIVLTNPTAGLATVTSSAAKQVAGNFWWRADVVSGGTRRSAAFGPRIVMPA